MLYICDSAVLPSLRRGFCQSQRKNEEAEATNAALMSKTLKHTLTYLTAVGLAGAGSVFAFLLIWAHSDKQTVILCPDLKGAAGKINYI